MKTICFTKRQVEKLEAFHLDREIINTEGALFVLKNFHRSKLLKIFYNNEGLYFGNKLLTINSLLDKKDEINIDSLVMPEELVIVNKKVAGFSMPLIENENLLLLLNDPNLEISKKINLLKQVGCILKQVQHQQPYGDPMYLSDIHPANFIYNADEDKVYAVDLDSCKIANNETPPIYYLEVNPCVKDLEFKYIRGRAGYFVPNANSEIFCYNMMILGTIANEKIFSLSTEEYFGYLGYLKFLDFSTELIDNFANLYTGKDNEFPCDLIDEIAHNPKTPRAHYKVYTNLKNKYWYLFFLVLLQENSKLKSIYFFIPIRLKG